MSLIALMVFSSIAISSDDSCCVYYSPGNPFNCTTHTLVGHEGDHGNCTWWCAYKRPEVSGPCYGNAILWLDQAETGGLSTGQMPAIGSIAVFDSYYINSEGHRVNGGHVAYVESVNNNGSFNVTEMGYEAWNCARTNILNSNSYDGLIGFIFPEENLTSFTFPNHSSQGWTCGYDTQTVSQAQTDVNTWMIAADDFDNSGESNPGVVSPSFANGINTDQFKILKFSVRVDGSGSNSPGYIWIKDSAGDWNHGVCFGNVPRDYNYHEYTADLAGAFSNLDISQISIELTENGGYEHWIFDSVKLISSYYHWDFTNSQLGWTIRQHGQFADFYDNTFWRIEPTGKQPQIVSPYLENISSDYIQLGIRYSAQGSNDTAIVRAYFDIGNGFGAIYSASSILRDGTTKTVTFDIPSNAVGNIQRVMFDLFDNNDYQNRSIAINNIGFLTGNADEDAHFYAAGGSDPPPSDNYTINRSTTCKDVQPSDPYNPISETTLFYNADNYVYSWIELNDVNKSLQINWKWYDSDNIFVSESGYATNPPPDGCIWGWYRCSNSLNIANTNNYGQYHVDIYADSQKIKTDYFTITIDLNPPTELTVETISESEINLSWNEVANATGYKIYRDNALIATLTNITYSNINLTNDTQYCYKVKAYCGNKDSGYSNQVCATTLSTKPGAPILRIIEQ